MAGRSSTRVASTCSWQHFALYFVKSGEPYCCGPHNPLHQQPRQQQRCNGVLFLNTKIWLRPGGTACWPLTGSASHWLARTSNLRRTGQCRKARRRRKKNLITWLLCINTILIVISNINKAYQYIINLLVNTKNVSQCFLNMLDWLLLNINVI